MNTPLILTDPSGPRPRYLADPDYEATSRMVGDHVRDLVRLRAERPNAWPTAWLHDDAEVEAEAVRSVVLGTQQGPWQRMDPWAQETAVAIAQRTARATLATLGSEAPPAPEY